MIFYLNDPKTGKEVRLHGCTGLHVIHMADFGVCFANEWLADKAKAATGWDWWDENILRMNFANDGTSPIAINTPYSDWGIDDDQIEG